VLLLLPLQPCEFPVADGSRMTCVVPRFVRQAIVDATNESNPRWNRTEGSGVAAFVALDDSSRADVYIGIQFDGYKRYENISREFPDMKFQFPPPPTLSCPPDGIEVDPGEDTVISIEVRRGDLVAEWLACWTQAQKGTGSNRSRDAVG